MFFAIASLALAVVLFTFVVNWDYVGGARGAYVLQPADVPFGLPRYIQLLFSIEVLMAARRCRRPLRSRLRRSGAGCAAIRDDELAAESAGVPTLRLKILSAAISGALMGDGGHAASLLSLLHRALLGVQPLLRGEQHRDAA